jgi:uncharacterized protein (DUF2132 family)
MTHNAGNDPLHGVTLEQLLNQLVDEFGWEILSDMVRINCFRSNPSIRSSLTFLRRTPWARSEVEGIFIAFKQGKTLSEIKAGLRQKNSRPANNKSGRKPAQQQQNRNKPGGDPWAAARQKDQQ